MYRIALSTVALASICSSQSLPCAALNDTTLIAPAFITSASFTGPNRIAYEFVPTQALLLYSMQIAIENTFRTTYMGVEIYDDDPITPQPGTRLAGGTWECDQSRPYTWQGANFDLLVPVSAGTRYWLVVTEPGFSAPPIEVAGGTTVPAFRWSSGAWMPMNNQAPKYRLFCDFLDGVQVTTSGGPCASSTGSLGTAFTNETPQLGNGAFALEGSGFSSGSLAFMVIGFTPGFPTIPLPGFPSNCTQSTMADDTIAGTTAMGTATGHVRFPLPIPTQTSLGGLVAGFQIAVLDAGAAASIPFITTNSVYVTLF